MAKSGPNMTQDGPKMGARWSPNGPKMAQDRPKMVQSGGGDVLKHEIFEHSKNIKAHKKEIKSSHKPYQSVLLLSKTHENQRC